MSDEIFSRHRRRLNRARAQRAAADSHWLLDRMAQELVDRLAFMTLDVAQVLVIGHGAAVVRPALPAAAELTNCDLAAGRGIDVVADEDRLPFGDARFDLVVACGTLDSIDDLPGALILIRRALRPGGLFLGAMLGAGSLSGLRQLVHQAEAATAPQSALRFHPQIEVRAAGDLLIRAGFSTPVADQEDIAAHYGAFATLRQDVRATGAGLALKTVYPMARATYQAIQQAAQDAPLAENFAPIYMTGWAPVTGEARPAGPVKGFL